MKTFIINTTIVCQFLFPCIALEANSLISAFNHKTEQLNAPVVATFWGGFKRFKIFDNNQGNVLQFKTKLFQSGHIDIYLRKVSSQKLIIFMPGIFGSIQEGLTPPMIDQLEQANANLLVIPNLLSSDYITAYPLYESNPISTETKILDQALDFATREIAQPSLEVHIIAESLGAMMASAWVSSDRQGANRIKSLTLLWPPLNLAVAMKNFDDSIIQHKNAENDCNIFIKGWLVVKEMILSDYPAKLSQRDELCLGSLVLSEGFVKKMKESWKTYSVITGSQKNAPETFEDFFKQYRPELWSLIEKHDDSTKLETWLKKITAKSDFPITIFTSKNDFLNKGMDWLSVKKNFNFTPDELIIFHGGGHSGPVGMDNFFEILKYYSPALNRI